MANTTPEYQGVPGQPTVGHSYFAGDGSLFGDPNLALFGGYGSLSTVQPGVSGSTAPFTTAGTSPANDGM
ncbi:MAG: hypothetical protein ABWY45_22100 [Mycobacterium sp.]